MAETEKKSFVLYFDTYFSISALPAEQRGELFSALFEYAMAEAEAPAEEDAVLNQHPEMGVAARMAFSFMAKSIRRDTEKWREKLSAGSPAALAGHGPEPAGERGSPPEGPGTG